MLRKPNRLSLRLWLFDAVTARCIENESGKEVTLDVPCRIREPKHLRRLARWLEKAADWAESGSTKAGASGGRLSGDSAPF